MEDEVMSAPKLAMGGNITHGRAPIYELSKTLYDFESKLHIKGALVT